MWRSDGRPGALDLGKRAEEGWVIGSYIVPADEPPVPQEEYGDLPPGMTDDEWATECSAIEDMVQCYSAAVRSREWIIGCMTLGGPIGFFPSNHLHPLDDLSNGCTLSQHRPESLRLIAVKESTAAALLLGPADRDVRGADKPFLRFSDEFKALYDWQSGEDGDLMFRAGERGYVVSDGPGAGWMTGSAGGAEGIFPSNYVRYPFQICHAPLVMSERLHIPSRVFSTGGNTAEPARSSWFLSL